MNKIIMLSGDPGITNFAVSITEYSKGSQKVLNSSMLECPIRSLVKADFDKQKRKFIRHFIKLIKFYKPTHMAFERFQQRGFRGGQAISECISVMLGILTCLAHKNKIDITLITAAQWKNDFQRVYKPLQEVYDEASIYKIAPHTIDSILIGWYIAEKQGAKSYKDLYKGYSKWLKTIQKALLPTK